MMLPNEPTNPASQAPVTPMVSPMVSAAAVQYPVPAPQQLGDASAAAIPAPVVSSTNTAPYGHTTVTQNENCCWLFCACCFERRDTHGCRLYPIRDSLTGQVYYSTSAPSCAEQLYMFWTVGACQQCCNSLGSCVSGTGNCIGEIARKAYGLFPACDSVKKCADTCLSAPKAACECLGSGCGKCGDLLSSVAKLPEAVCGCLGSICECLSKLLPK